MMTRNTSLPTSSDLSEYLTTPRNVFGTERHSGIQNRRRVIGGFLIYFKFQYSIPWHNHEIGRQ